MQGHCNIHQQFPMIAVIIAHIYVRLVWSAWHLEIFFPQKHLRWSGSRLVTLAASERCGSDERVDGGETVGNSFRELRWEGAVRKRREGGRKGNNGK